MTTLVTDGKEQSAIETIAEVYKKGDWLKLPALEIKGQVIFIEGKLLRVAVVRSQEWLEQELQDPELCVAELKRRKRTDWHADLFTFSQKLPATKPKYDYPLEWQSVAAIHLTSFTEWWEGLPQATRKNVRRSEKRGVQVTLREFDDDMVNDLVELTTKLPVQQGGRNRQYGKSSAEIRKDFGSFLERSDLICAYVGGELVGFLKLVYRREVASVLNLVVKASHQDKRPANALIAKAIQRCEVRHVSYVTYGFFNYGKKQEGSLREFKMRNGFSEVLVPKYYVPLTRWGAFCLRLGLHRELVGILPYWIVEFAVRARTRWYNFRYSNEPV